MYNDDIALDMLCIIFDGLSYFYLDSSFCANLEICG